MAEIERKIYEAAGAEPQAGLKPVPDAANGDGAAAAGAEPEERAA
jgi:hypothetical protein